MSRNNQGNSPSDVSAAKRTALKALDIASGVQSALQNRKASVSEALVSPYTPPTVPTQAIIAATLVTPKSSGIFLLFVQLVVTNGASPDTFFMTGQAFTGTNLVVGGGSVTNGGWTQGSTVPPTVTGTGITAGPVFGELAEAIPATTFDTLSIAGMNPTPLPLGVPSAIEVLISEQGGGHALGTIQFVTLSIVELP